nr:uncharacterized protein LOC117994086 [Maniola hyperantus]
MSGNNCGNYREAEERCWKDQQDEWKRQDREEAEKLALVEVVERHFNIVENKKTDAASVAEKREEWRKIATEFNTVSCLHPREWEVLKNCWENLKKKAKNKLTLQNQHFLGTGGGPPKKIIDDPAIERVLQLIQSRVSGFVNEYDSDNTQVIASSQPDTLSVRIADEEHDTVLSDISNTVLVQESESGPILDENISTEAATTMTLDWSQYNPSMLREPMNHILGRLESPLPDRQQPAQPDVTFSDAQQLHHTPSRAKCPKYSKVRLKYVMVDSLRSLLI